MYHHCTRCTCSTGLLSYIQRLAPGTIEEVSGRKLWISENLIPVSNAILRSRIQRSTPGYTTDFNEHIALLSPIGINGYRLDIFECRMLHREMPRTTLRLVRVGLGVLLCLIVVFTAVRVGGPRLKRKVFFLFISRTTDPMALLEERIPEGIHIPYGPDPSQYGELRVPAGNGPFPIAILVHGGCWRARLRQAPPEATSVNLLRPLSEALAKEGIASWNIEYRRLGNPGGGWAGSYQDVGNAADHLVAFASKYHLDLTRTIAIGHSSGGQLALWLAARHKLSSSSPLYRPSPIPVQGVLDLDGPPDMDTASTWDSTACNDHVVAQFLGGTPAEVPDRYHDGSAAALLPLGVRQEILYSGKTEFMADNEQKWAGLFQAYAAKGAQAGDQIEVARLDRGGHFDGLNPRSTSWPVVHAKLQQLLQKP